MGPFLDKVKRTIKKVNQKKKLVKNKFVKKSWGWELWFDNNNSYCGKTLFVNYNFWSSKGNFHYHKEKLETFFVLDGELKLVYIDNKEVENTIILYPEQSFRIEPGTKHKFTAKTKTGCKFIEVSTFHSDDDSYRTYFNKQKGIWVEY